MSWLVIGVGNTLRRDDGLGAWLAERIAAWRLPGVTIRVVHQLTPELAAEFENQDRVLFVDASRSDDTPHLIEVKPGNGETRLGHAFGPHGVVALAAWIHGKVPQAWIMVTPGFDFGFGEGISDAARQSGEQALAVIGSLLREDTLCTKSA
jgi:hydrogenase maturation protease